MTLKKIANSIKYNQNIIEKKEISPIVQYIDKNSFKSTKIFTDIGEDAATIKHDDKYILVTTDRIKTAYIENFAYGAGYSSILVSVDDIYACGGTPLAASIIISVKNPESCEEILKGICAGSNKFKVPIIRGHTNIHGKCYELSSTMIGEIKKEDYISAGNAKVGDNIMLAVDFDGKVGKASKYYYDTTTFKDSGTVLRKRHSMNKIAKMHLVNSSKDVSNGGIFGTILQLIKYSKIGADVNINKITIPPKLINEGYDLETYLQMYLTTSFVLTAPNSNYKKIIEIFQEFEMNANVIGKIINDQNLLRINNGSEALDVIRF
ncbi:MAG: AIR synthase related protein [Candidatus Thorarchaeota archaeon]